MKWGIKNSSRRREKDGENSHDEKSKNRYKIDDKRWAEQNLPKTWVLDDKR